MTSIEEIVVSALKGDAPVGGFVGDRVYFVHAPQGAALPRVLYQTVSTGARPQGMGRDVPVERVRVQFTAQASSPTGARDLAEAIKDAFDQFKSAGPPVVSHSRFAGAVDIPTGARPAASSEGRIYARTVDIAFIYRRD